MSYWHDDGDGTNSSVSRCILLQTTFCEKMVIGNQKEEKRLDGSKKGYEFCTDDIKNKKGKGRKWEILFMICI